MVDFALAIPAMRRRVKRDLAGCELTRERVLACATRLLDLGFFRIGSEEYAEQNDSYGLATMLKRHVRVEREEIVFDYEAKSGRRRVQAIAEPAVHDVIRALKRRRGGGPELLAYRDGRRWVDVRSEDINEYLKAATGHAFSAKDFRTWNATVLAAVSLAAVGAEAETKTARKRAITESVKAVSESLGNTPAVCRASYIDPRVFDRYRSGQTIAAALDREGRDADLFNAPTRTRIEAAVLHLIGDQVTPALVRVPR
jgi:DNA topoisomerase IB